MEIDKHRKQGYVPCFLLFQFNTIFQNYNFSFFIKSSNGSLKCILAESEFTLDKSDFTILAIGTYYTNTSSLAEYVSFR